MLAVILALIALLSSQQQANVTYNKIYNILRGGLLLRRPPAEETVSCRGGLLLRRPPAEVETASLQPMYLVFDPTKKYIYTLMFFQRRADEFQAGVAPSQIRGLQHFVIDPIIDPSAAPDASDAVAEEITHVAAGTSITPPAAPPAAMPFPLIAPFTPGMHLPSGMEPAEVDAEAGETCPAPPNTPSVGSISAAQRAIGVVG